MNIRKMEIQIKNNNKLIIKNKSPKNKEEYLSKKLTKKDFKSSKPPIKNFNIYFNEKKSTSKVNLFEENKIKNNIIKKASNNKTKKRQNKFFKNKLKDKEPSSINSNLNLYKIINSKDGKSNNVQQSSSITTDSVNSYISNTSNKISNNKCISLLHKNEVNIDTFKRKRLDSNISHNSSHKSNFYTSKDSYGKNDIKKISNCTNNINKSNNKSKNPIKKINMTNSKFIKNINLENKPIRNNIIELSNTEDKKDIKIKGLNNIYSNINNKNKGENICIHNKNISNKKIFIKNCKKTSKEKNKNEIKEKNNIEKEEKKEKLFTNNNKKINLYNSSNNFEKEINYLDINNNNTDYINNKDFYSKKNLNPVKKSLFTEHMNFLNNRQEEKNLYYNNNDFINNNGLKFPFDNILDSTDKKDYESKFINYDLGKTTGTSLSKDSLFLFGNKNNEKNKNTKIINLPRNENINVEEKERTQEEMEKLAKEYLNMSKYWGNRDEYYKQNINQTNTITTVIDDNNSNEDTIL